ncbi:hypothetical protein VSR01_04370 [Actinacidiphila sp. DG2A-62]|uniref:hypothetical protein n=1 Tax=Actinacidiphila sp. DG2A-62 TaxID=3108821 RepID=UPI002DBF1335|nr:hypothetical protein [Actinacidiphila sp. DG2A-62]MEC3992820.1 hypothetical protein [Actinacidiphila sp. DG2A-62]
MTESRTLAVSVLMLGGCALASRTLRRGVPSRAARAGLTAAGLCLCWLAVVLAH